MRGGGDLEGNSSRCGHSSHTRLASIVGMVDMLNWGDRMCTIHIFHGADEVELFCEMLIMLVGFVVLFLVGFVAGCFWWVCLVVDCLCMFCLGVCFGGLVWCFCFLLWAVLVSLFGGFVWLVCVGGLLGGLV